MSGIRNYFHGETGEVVALGWSADRHRLTYRMRLRGNPHRKLAQDYHSDILIDPTLAPGDEALYVRLDEYCGIWLKKGCELEPELGQALARGNENRESIDRYLSILDFGWPAAMVWAKLWLRAASRSRVDLDFLEATLPSPDVQVAGFISCGSEDIEWAEKLQNRLKLTSWRERWTVNERTGGVPAFRREVRDWLEREIGSRRILVVVTGASASSDWLQEKVAWAARKGDEEDDFHLVLLSLEETVEPAGSGGRRIACQSLATFEVVEELYAAVYGRGSRSKWLETRRRLGEQAADLEVATAEPRDRASLSELALDTKNRSRREVVSCLPRILCTALGFTLLMFVLVYFGYSNVWGRLQVILLLIFFTSSVVLGAELAAGLLSEENFRRHNKEAAIDWDAFSRLMKSGFVKGFAAFQALILLAAVIPAFLVTAIFQLWSGIPMEMFLQTSIRDILFFTVYLFVYGWVYFSYVPRQERPHPRG